MRVLGFRCKILKQEEDDEPKLPTFGVFLNDTDVE